MKYIALLCIALSSCGHIEDTSACDVSSEFVEQITGPMGGYAFPDEAGAFGSVWVECSGKRCYQGVNAPASTGYVEQLWIYSIRNECGYYLDCIYVYDGVSWGLLASEPDVICIHPGYGPYGP